MSHVLAEALKFSAEDVQANRQGKLSAAQRKRLNKQQRRAVQWGAAAFVVFVVLATFFLYVGQTQASGIATLTGMLITTLNALSLGLIGRHVMRLRADQQAGVLTLRGTLERVLKPDRRIGNYVLRLQNQEWIVTKEQFKLFAHEAAYALYVTQHTRQILSAERLEDA
ncbi:MAG: hypothetical protein NZ750_06340 [Anaerolineae bacterium]|nr:hypothetical protein [Anaerolineae bacterium]MDW8171702.1 hypothetical protein [Anaerolineae bacterium]